MELEQRVLRLERTVKRYRGIAGLAGLAMAAWIGFGATHPASEVIRAGKFEVVNPLGNVVVTLEAIPEHGAVTIADSQGDVKTILSVSPNHGGILQMYNRKDALILIAGVSEENHGLINLYDHNGAAGLQLYGLNGMRTGGGMVVRNVDNEPVSSIGVNRNKDGELIGCKKKAVQCRGIWDE